MALFPHVMLNFYIHNFINFAPIPNVISINIWQYVPLHITPITNLMLIRVDEVRTLGSALDLI